MKHVGCRNSKTGRTVLHITLERIVEFLPLTYCILGPPLRAGQNLSEEGLIHETHGPKAYLRLKPTTTEGCNIILLR